MATKGFIYNYQRFRRSPARTCGRKGWSATPFSFVPTPRLPPCVSASAHRDRSPNTPNVSPSLLRFGCPQDQDEGCYLYEYHSPLNAATRMGQQLSLAVTALAAAVAAALGAAAAA